MIAAVDVDYRDDAVVGACVLFDDWSAVAVAREFIQTHPANAADYAPGEFFRRELPYLLELLAGIACAHVIVDGYAWLGPDRMGLGAHLHAALGTPVIGVAKTKFASASAIEVIRGDSASPLFITTAGCDAELAAANVRAMHGPFRMPTLLKRVDHLARGLQL